MMCLEMVFRRGFEDWWRIMVREERLVRAFERGLLVAKKM
jgi:hypothetical protein